MEARRRKLTNPRLRSVWERKWRILAGPEFGWHLTEPPPELVRLMEAGSLPDGAALDLGCGDGVAAMYIAGFRRPSVGADIAVAAVERATGMASEAGSAASFLAAEAPLLPFRSQSFALVFDRGCLQNLTRVVWPAYFQEAERLLRPGGLLQLYASRPEFGPPLSPRGIVNRLRALRSARRRHKREFFSRRPMRRALPASFEPLEVTEFPFRTTDGRKRRFIYILARRR
ncbi:MAG: class I SAM-dependent methyltransferase [Actinomycetota bacterium]